MPDNKIGSALIAEVSMDAYSQKLSEQEGSMTFESNIAWDRAKCGGFMYWWQRIEFVDSQETVVLAAIYFQTPPIRLMIEAALYNERGNLNPSFATFDWVNKDDFTALLTLSFPEQTMSAREFFDNFIPTKLAQRMIKRRKPRRLVQPVPLDLPDHFPDAWL